MGLFSAVGNLFSYQEPAPPNDEKKRRFELMGKSNRELNIILNQTPHLHCKKTKLVDLIMAREFEK